MSFRPDDIEQSIARDEEWLRDTLAEPPGFNADALKQRIRIELNQQWLASELVDEEPTNLLARTKQSVQATLDTASQNKAQSRTQSLRIVRWASSVLATAACVVFVVNAYRHTAPSSEPDISYLSAFEQYEAENFTESFASLRSDLTSLTTNKTQDDSDVDDDTFDDLRKSIDTLVNPSSFSSDWS